MKILHTQNTVHSMKTNVIKLLKYKIINSQIEIRTFMERGKYQCKI